MKIQLARITGGSCIVMKSPFIFVKMKIVTQSEVSKSENSAQRMQDYFAVMFLLRIS